MAKSAEIKGRKRRSRRAREGEGGQPPKGGRTRQRDEGLRFTSVNALFGGAALVTVVAGYVLLAQGSITAAPLLLALGYLILFPVALVK